jgi:DNA polymerase III alpha subunit (gram-positive type)
MENTFILDFETTGLNPYHDEIIEIAIKPYGIDDIYSKLTKPLKPTKLNDKVVQITKITDDMLSNDGINIYTAFDEMINFIIKYIKKEEPIYLLAHNGTMFDFILLQNLFKSYHKQKKLSSDIINILNKFVYIDTLLLSRYLMPKRYTYSQNALAKTFNIKQTAAHRAYGDVIVLEQIFNSLIKNYCQWNSYDFKENLNIKNINNMLYNYSLY